MKLWLAGSGLVITRSSTTTGRPFDPLFALLSVVVAEQDDGVAARVPGDAAADRDVGVGGGDGVDERAVRPRSRSAPRRRPRRRSPARRRRPEWPKRRDGGSRPVSFSLPGHGWLTRALRRARDTGVPGS